MLITLEGKIIRIAAGNVSKIGRSTQGVKVMNLDAGDRLVAAAKIEDRDDESLEEEDSAPDLEDGAPTTENNEPVN